MKKMSIYESDNQGTPAGDHDMASLLRSGFQMLLTWSEKSGQSEGSGTTSMVAKELTEFGDVLHGFIRTDRVQK